MINLYRCIEVSVSLLSFPSLFVLSPSHFLPTSHRLRTFSLCALILHYFLLVYSILLFPFRSSLQPKPENAVTIAVSSRVLFRTECEQKVFEQKGVEEYLRYQVEHENEPFAPGPAFAFVKVKDTQLTSEQTRVAQTHIHTR